MMSPQKSVHQECRLEPAGSRRQRSMVQCMKQDRRRSVLWIRKSNNQPNIGHCTIESPPLIAGPGPLHGCKDIEAPLRRVPRKEGGRSEEEAGQGLLHLQTGDHPSLEVQPDGAALYTITGNIAHTKVSTASLEFSLSMGGSMGLAPVPLGSRTRPMTRSSSWR